MPPLTQIIKKRNSLTGFTLIEILVSITILALISLMVGFFILQGYKYWNLTQAQKEVQEQAKNNLGDITKEIRKAQIAQSGAYAIGEAQPLSLIFYADIDAAPDIEKIHYFLEDNNLVKEIIKPSGDPPAYTQAPETKIISSYLINNEENPIFSYFDENYAGASDPLPYPIAIDQIRLIRLNLTIDADTFESPPPYTLKSEVNLRNLKSNL